MRFDLGFAPNPYDGVCTFACCMGNTRRTAKLDDWLIGMGGTDLKATGRCVYAMRVTADLSFEQYWKTGLKRPVRNGSRRAMVGDNIYHRDPTTGLWIQEDSVHSQPGGAQDPLNTAHDTKTNRVLLSRDFVYFGSNAPRVPQQLLDQIDYRNWRGGRVFNYADCEKLIAWILDFAGSQRNRVLGDPFQFHSSQKRFSRELNRLL